MPTPSGPRALWPVVTILFVSAVLSFIAVRWHAHSQAVDAIAGERAAAVRDAEAFRNIDERFEAKRVVCRRLVDRVFSVRHFVSGKDWLGGVAVLHDRLEEYRRGCFFDDAISEARSRLAPHDGGALDRDLVVLDKRQSDANDATQLVAANLQAIANNPLVAVAAMSSSSEDFWKAFETANDAFSKAFVTLQTILHDRAEEANAHANGVAARERNINEAGFLDVLGFR